MTYDELRDKHKVEFGGIVYRKGPVFELSVVEEEGEVRYFISDIMSRELHEISKNDLINGFLPKDKESVHFSTKKIKVDASKEGTQDETASKRKPGRPKGTKNTTDPSKPKLNKDGTVRRKPGRPKGSKSKV